MKNMSMQSFNIFVTFWDVPDTPFFEDTYTRPNEYRETLL